MKHLPKVFVVDDDSAVVQSLDALLKAHGYDVECFATTAEFKKRYHPTQVGCVLIDLMIPGMGGSEVLKLLHETGSLLSVVVISGLIDPATFDDGQKQGVSLLEKPYEISTLLTMVADGVAGSFRRRAERHRGR